MTSQSNSRPKDLEPLTDRDPRQLGRFRLVGRLGSGGMGVAYFAEIDGVHGVEPAVVKVVHANLAADRSFSARLSRELDVMRKVSGRFTAQLLDSDVNHDPPWFAMEYIPGLTLARLIEEFGPLATEQLIPFANQLLEIIANIHAQGVVHRDIKPANIMMSPTGPRLIDFGIADLSEGTQLTKTGSVLGSMGWMAPEQVRNDPATPATDIHAWALTVLFASTGQAPFGAANSTAAMYKVLEETPRIPQSIPPPLAQALKQALVKQPNYRPVIGQLQAAINVRGVVVPPRTGTQTPTDPQPPTPSALRQRPNFKPLLIITVIGFLIGGLAVQGYNSSPSGQTISDTTTTNSQPPTVPDIADTTTTNSQPPTVPDIAIDTPNPAVAPDSDSEPVVSFPTSGDNYSQCVAILENASAYFYWGITSGGLVGDMVDQYTRELIKRFGPDAAPTTLVSTLRLTDYFYLPGEISGNEENILPKKEALGRTSNPIKEACNEIRP